MNRGDDRGVASCSGMPGDNGFGYSRQIAWVVVISAAIAIEILTHNAIVASILPCAHVATGSLVCGFWLLKSDAKADRARTCFWFYLAAACCAAAAFAFIGIPILALVEFLEGRPPTEDAIAATLLTLLGAIALTVVVGLVAIVSAVRSRTRVWVHPGIRRMCNVDFGRIGSCIPSHRFLNRAVFVLGVSLLFPIAFAGTALLIWMACVDPVAPPLVPTILGFILLLGGPLAMIPVYACLSSRIVAQSPSECWPPSLSSHDLDRLI
jgi:hypothetical protein